MAALFASMALEGALDNISSLLPANSTSQAVAATNHGLNGLDDLQILERTMRRIHSMLLEAEKHWNTREKSAKLRLEELKELAYDAEEVVEEYEYEVNRRKVEAFERLAAVQAGKIRKRKLMMAGLIASLAIRKALDKLSSFLTASASSLNSGNAREEQDLEDLRMLERTMRRIHATLHDAEQHWNITEASTKLRLEELKDLAYDAEEVVDQYELNRHKVEAFKLFASSGSHKRKYQQENEGFLCESSLVTISDEMAIKTKKLIERFDEIKHYSDNFTLSENDGERWLTHIGTIDTSSAVFEQSIVGREKDKDKIVEKLVSIRCDSVASPVSVMAIVGMRGLGKTTLAQLVYNHPKVGKYFDVCAWVCVSDQFDVSSITRSIVVSVTKEKCDLLELCNLQEILVEEIKQKKVLLVLDDLWNERKDFWDLLCMPMNTTKLCMIVVTTWSEKVAKLVQTMPLYNLNCLSYDESWSLFKQVAFIDGQENTPSNAVEMGRAIVKKCNGLPLVIRKLGSMLRYETNEQTWREVLESDLWVCSNKE
uniref:NB-ARC domain-containing protein n=1 Tax=Leersia perrieri TaxID=77586 RepID=A0A0D9XS95_9ORYZ